MTIRNLGANIVDILRYNYIEKSFLETGARKYLLVPGFGVKPFKHIYSKYATISIGIDVAQSPHDSKSVDIIYDGRNILFPTMNLILYSLQK